MSHVQTASRAERLRVGHEEIAFRITPDQGAGDVLALDVTLPAGGGPPALHRHAPAEIYLVVAGELAFYFGDGDAITREVAPAGAVVQIAAHQEHTVRNESGAEARAYVTFTGDVAGMHAFTRAAAALAASGEPDVEQVLALAAAHGVEITRPLRT